MESPHGELLQVELLRLVTAAGGEGFHGVRAGRVQGDVGLWEDTEYIGDAAVLVDVAGAMAASTRVCPALRPNTVYYAVDLEGETRVWAYSLAGKHKRIEVVEVLPTAGVCSSSTIVSGGGRRTAGEQRSVPVNVQLTEMVEGNTKPIF